MSQYKIVMAVDFYKPAVECFKANFTDADVRLDRVENIKHWPQADIILGGVPCQPFSTAGRMQQENDDRNGFPAFISAVEKIRPKQFLIENVNGFWKSKYRHYVEEQLIDLGYNVDCKTLDSADYGVPQHRRRCWVWGIRNDISVDHKWPAPQDKWIGIAEALNKPLEPTFEYINKYPHNPYTKPADPKLPANPIFSKFHGKNSDLVMVDASKNQVYKMTIDDALIIQSVPPTFKWAEKQSKSSKWVIVGNGWASRMGYHFAKAFKAVDPSCVTVIDLFCGGGLGAAGWHSWSGE